MLRNCLSHLPRPQSIVVFPLKLDPSSTTTRLNFFFARGPENRLPGKSETIAEVTHVHHELISKTLPDFRRQKLEDLAAVGNRSLAALLRRQLTAEPHLHGPRVRVRHLVVQQDRAIGREFS